MLAWVFDMASGVDRLGIGGRGWPLRCLVVNGDDDTDILRRRMWALCQHHGVPPSVLQDRVHLVGVDQLVAQGVDLELASLDAGKRERSAEWLTRTCRELRLDVVGVDPLVTMAGAELTNEDAVRELGKTLKRVAMEQRVAVMVNHHTRKGPVDTSSAEAADASYGSTFIGTYARTTLLLSGVTERAHKDLGLSGRPSDYSEVTSTKQSYARASVDDEVYYKNDVDIRVPGAPERVGEVALSRAVVGAAVPEQVILDTIVEMDGLGHGARPSHQYALDKWAAEKVSGASRAAVRVAIDEMVARGVLRKVDKWDSAGNKSVRYEVVKPAFPG
jgi:hypothetical protein